MPVSSARQPLPQPLFVCARKRNAAPLRTATLAEPLAASGPREFYQPAAFDAARKSVRPLAWKGSADIYTLAAADVLLVRPENAPAARTGDPIDVLEV